MGTASQIFRTFSDPAPGTNWGRINRNNDASPYYERHAADEEWAPAGARYAGGPGAIYRGFIELDMAVLVTDGYEVGKTILAASLRFNAQEGNSAIRIVCDPIASLSDSDADLFAKLGPSNQVWSADTLILSSGASGIVLNKIARAIIAHLGATDKRVIGFCLIDESVDQKSVTVDEFTNAELRITF